MHGGDWVGIPSATVVTMVTFVTMVTKLRDSFVVDNLSLFISLFLSYCHLEVTQINGWEINYLLK
jgi:hypothetical protein